MLTHKGTVTLKNERLTLRRLAVEDAQEMYDNWATEEKVARYVAWSVHKSVEETKELLANWVPGYEKPDYYHWVIEFDGDLIGTIGLHTVSDKSWRAEMGYCIGSRWWGRGLVAEAAREVVRFAFDEVGLNKIGAYYDMENPGSGKVMHKVGMVREGYLVKHSRRKDGSWGDSVYCSVLNQNIK